MKPKKALRILYAEDMPELRDIMRTTLGREGHSVETVPDGKPALELLQANPSAFDLVISDHHMAVMNGLELVTLLRASAFPGRIIVFSSELDPEVTVAYRGLQVDAILFKPVLPHELRQIIANF
jgi:CheY-like chemotaxis protein